MKKIIILGLIVVFGMQKIYAQAAIPPSSGAPIDENVWILSFVFGVIATAFYFKKSKTTA